MKAINCFYFLFILSLLFFCSYQSDDTCPTGITQTINQFSVKGGSDSLVLKKVLDQYNKKWIDITNSVITYANGENNRITALDLAESDGETLISSYGSYPSDFDVIIKVV